MVPVYPLKIQKKIRETRDSVSLILEPPLEHESLFMYQPAQFLTFHFNINKKKYHRSYSISSCPLLNEDLKTTVKRVTGGVISNYIIDSLHEGDMILSRKPAGRFFKPASDLKPKQYFLFAGGSGITPLFSILKTALISDAQNQVTLFYANRDEESIIYKQEIQDYLSKYQNFHCIHILSRPSLSWADIPERLNHQHLERFFPPSHPFPSSYLFYLCGPLGFMQTIENFLKDKIPSSQVRKESFVSGGPKKKEPQNNKTKTSCSLAVSQNNQALVVCGKMGESQVSKPRIIRAVLDGHTIEVPAPKDDKTPLLEHLLATGHAPPFSCLSGSCMSCLATLKKGRIQQLEQGILEDENIARHEILTCQAIPQSVVVEIDYDNI